MAPCNCSQTKKKSPSLHLVGVARKLWEQEDVSEEDILTIEELVRGAIGVEVIGEWSYPCGQSILFMD